MGHTIEEQGYSYGIVPEKETIAVKMPVFSFEKIKGAEISLGPEMKSTGEVLGISKNLDEAIYKAFWEQVFNYLRERISFVQLKILLKKNSYQSLNNIICLL